MFSWRNKKDRWLSTYLELYSCIDHFQVNKMSMTENVDNDPVRFMLKDQTPGADVKFLIQAPSEEVKRTWVSAVQKILEMQGDFLRGEIILARLQMAV